METKNQTPKKSASELLTEIEEALSQFDEVRGFL
jgi:hypothetical protein